LLALPSHCVWLYLERIETNKDVEQTNDELVNRQFFSL